MDKQRFQMICDDIFMERMRQEEKFGPQSLPSGTETRFVIAADYAKNAYDEAVKDGTLSWRHVLDEEVKEAFSETDPDRLRAELIQVAAVAMRWIEDMDSRDIGRMT